MVFQRGLTGPENHISMKNLSFLLDYFKLRFIFLFFLVLIIILYLQKILLICDYVLLLKKY